MAGNSRLRKLIGSLFRIGLGGEGVLRQNGRDREALAMLEAAHGIGIRYYDSAPAYAESEQYYGHFWAEHLGWRSLLRFRQVNLHSGMLRALTGTSCGPSPA